MRPGSGELGDFDWDIEDVEEAMDGPVGQPAPADLQPQPPQPLKPRVIRREKGVAVVVFVQLRCPFCASPKIKSYGTYPLGKTVKRYHQCRECAGRFQSEETTPLP